jgi:cell division transport system permease protein
MFKRRPENHRRGATPLDQRPKQSAAVAQGKKADKPKKTRRKGEKAPTMPNAGGYWQGHVLAMNSAIQRLQRTPVQTIMTIMVIAIALSLPAALQVLIGNAKLLGGGIEDSAQISLFLEDRATSGQAQALQAQLSERADVSRVDFVSREQALAEFQSLSGFSDALNTLGENPLPHVLIIFPQLDGDQAQPLEQLRSELAEQSLVHLAQLDLAWIERLFAIIDILQSSAIFLSLFLAFSVLMVVGNTIRLLSQNYRDEIEVYKLVGATDAFVRRPFVYSGLFYGLVGSVIAVLLVSIAALWVSGPVDHLAALYQSNFHLQGLGLSDLLVIILIGAILGLGGAWAAVNRYLKELDL